MTSPDREAPATDGSDEVVANLRKVFPKAVARIEAEASVPAKEEG